MSAGQIGAVIGAAQKHLAADRQLEKCSRANADRSLRGGWHSPVDPTEERAHPAEALPPSARRLLKNREPGARQRLPLGLFSCRRSYSPGDTLVHRAGIFVEYSPCPCELLAKLSKACASNLSCCENWTAQTVVVAGPAAVLRTKSGVAPCAPYRQSSTA